MNEKIISSTENFSTTDKDLNYLGCIDGLRGVAILMVIYFHSTLAVGSLDSFKESRVVLEHFSRGVQLFFIISAFTLFRSSKIRDASEKRSKLNFYIRRFFRILPLWWIAVLLYWIFQREEHTAFDAWATALMFFGFYKEIQTMALIPVGWSLFVEETFYLIFPLIKKRITGLASSLLFVLGSIWIANKWFSFSVGAHYDPFFIGTFPLANSYAFFIGISLYFVYEKIKVTNFFSCSLSKIFWLDFLSIACFWGIFYTNRINGTLLFSPLFLTSFFENSICGKILNFKLLKKFGKYCYSIYLFHSLIISQVCIWGAKYINKESVNENNFYGFNIGLFLIISSLSLLVGASSFHLFELRFISLGKKVIRKFDF